LSLRGRAELPVPAVMELSQFILSRPRKDSPLRHPNHHKCVFFMQKICR